MQGKWNVLSSTCTLYKCYIVWGDRGNSTLMLQLQSLHNKAAKIILDLPIESSASEALNKLKWKTLARCRAEHSATFIYKCLNNLFSHRFNIEFNKDKHDFNTRYKNNIRKSASGRNWGHCNLDLDKFCLKRLE